MCQIRMANRLWRLKTKMSGGVNILTFARLQVWSPELCKTFYFGRVGSYVRSICCVEFLNSGTERHIVPNGLRLGEEADLIALNCQLAQMFLESTTVQLTTNSAFLPRCCYQLAFCLSSGGCLCLPCISFSFLSLA